jgi:hypothetical protein
VLLHVVEGAGVRCVHHVVRAGVHVHVVQDVVRAGGVLLLVFMCVVLVLVFMCVVVIIVLVLLCMFLGCRLVSMVCLVVELLEELEGEAVFGHVE